MKTRWEIILAGSGGQGLGLAGKILGEAAIQSENANVAHSQSYGAESRGGASQSSLVISREEIIYPIVEEIDLLIALSPLALTTYEPRLAENGVLIFDLSLQPPDENTRGLGFPFAAKAQQLGHPTGITLMALGAATEIMAIVAADALIAAIEAHFQGEMLKANLQAFDLGREMAREPQGR